MTGAQDPQRNRGLPPASNEARHGPGKPAVAASSGTRRPARRRDRARTSPAPPPRARHGLAEIDRTGRRPRRPDHPREMRLVASSASGRRPDHDVAHHHLDAASARRQPRLRRLLDHHRREGGRRRLLRRQRQPAMRATGSSQLMQSWSNYDPGRISTFTSPERAGLAIAGGASSSGIVREIMGSTDTRPLAIRSAARACVNGLMKAKRS